MGICGGQERGIDPAKMSVGAAINDVDAAMCGMTEHQHRRSRQIQFGHGIADRELFERGC